MKTLPLLIVCISLMNASPNNHSMNSIIPHPQSVVERDAYFKITSSTKIIIGETDPEMQFIAEQLNHDLRERNGEQLKVEPEASVRRLGTNYIFIGSPITEIGSTLLKVRKGSLSPEMKAEGYFLDVNASGIALVAESEQGLFYGMMSLLQIIGEEGRSIIVDGGTIHDWPAERFRGTTDDISRGQVSTLDNFKTIVRFLARYKMNTYSPYIEDMFQFTSYPDIGKGRGALTQAECRELDAYAKKYFVELIPIFETLGHWENILLQPNYRDLGEFPGAHTVNVSDERVYTMLDSMIGDLASCFSSPYFNMAADESWDVGLGANKERVAKSDIATVHAEHYKRVFEIIKKHGKLPMMYGDVILNNPDILTKIPNDVVIVDWHYGANLDYPSTGIFNKAGFRYITCPAVWNFTGPFPNYINTFVNIQRFNEQGWKNGAMGVLCSNWNDFGGEALRELNYYGYAWTAECAWNPQAANQVQYTPLFLSDFYRTQETDDLQSIYSLLSDPANQYHWYELWRHPMLPNRDNMIWEVRLPLIQRMQSIRSTMPFVLDLIKKAKGHVTANKEHLTYLHYVADMNLWFAKKIESQEMIKLWVRQIDSTTNMDDLARRIDSICADVNESLNAVRSEFKSAWLTTNKPEGLQNLMDRYDRQVAYWDELAEQVKHGNFQLDPSLQSKWIYHPDAHVGTRDTMQVPQAYFRRSFSLPSRLISAKVQLLGNTWSQLYVNGKFIGEVFARRSLSLVVEKERAKIFDITPYMTDSSNTLAVMARNFETGSSGGANVYCEFKFADGTILPMQSDSTWKASTTELKGWEEPGFDDSTWKHAAEFPFPTPIVKPNFATDRTSWYER